MNQEKFTLFQGDSREVIKQIPDNSIDSVVTDPPYGLNFMGKYWDTGEVAFDPKFWEEVLRVLKPGGHLLAFSGSRTYHRMACAIEDAGFEIRDQIMWLYGCLDEATEVATEKGVMPYHKTKIGDRVLCYNVEHGEYTYQPILEIVEYDYSDTAFRLVGDFGEQVVSKNHRVIVERDGNEVFQIAETLECEARVPVLESLPALRKALGEPDVVCDQRAAQGVRAWGGHKTAVVRVIPLHYTGKVWCLRVPTGAFVAVRNGVAFPTGNSGFPKSHDVAKAIDKANGIWRGRAKGVKSANGSMAGANYERTPKGAPVSDEAQRWAGWGTALKPAHEPIVVARKPLVGTVAENVLAHGTGALNIDGCRVEHQSEADRAAATPQGRVTGKSGAFAGKVQHDGERSEFARPDTTLGRWPANVIHDGSDEVIAAFPTENGKSTSRFFYCPKASKTDRNDGLNSKTNVHPTVKPTKLMQYLCRLVTPPGGTVLDPFTGSGSTGRGAILEGFRFVGIERDPEYIEIAEARIRAVSDHSENNTDTVSLL